MRIFVFAAVTMLCGACAMTPSVGERSSAEIDALRTQVQTLEEQNRLLDLKLQDEIERSTIQNFLRLQEVAAARRETVALRARCGDVCAEEE